MTRYPFRVRQMAFQFEMVPHWNDRAKKDERIKSTASLEELTRPTKTLIKSRSQIRFKIAARAFGPAGQKMATTLLFGPIAMMAALRWMFRAGTKGTVKQTSIGMEKRNRQQNLTKAKPSE